MRLSRRSIRAILAKSKVLSVFLFADKSPLVTPYAHLRQLANGNLRAFILRREMRYNQDRVNTYKKYWQELTEMYGNLCFYCRREMATTIDHVVPYSWDSDNRISNLVPACGLCNSIASNKMFDSVIQKQAYILKQRGKYTAFHRL